MVFPNGSVVEIFGLQNAADLNGKQGTISSYDSAKGRYIVFANGGHKSLKESNLRKTGGTGSGVTGSQSLKRWIQAAKKKVEIGIQRGHLWASTRGVDLWSSSPFPKILLVLLCAGLAVRWMSNDPRYAGSPSSQTREHYDQEPRRPYDSQRESQDYYDTKRSYSYDSQRDYNYNQYNSGPGYDYGHHRSYDSGSSSMMWALLLGGGYVAYRAGLFDRLQGMNWFQMAFLMNLFSSLFGGFRMGMPGMGGLGGMFGGRRRRMY